MNGIHSSLSTNFLLKQNQNLDQLREQKVKHQKELEEVSSQFEALFVNQLLATMRDSVPESELLPNSHGEKMFHSMLDQEYAKMASKSNSLGLGKMVYEELKPKLDQ
ncbi:MAG: rod-binding protein [SAR324 cluster bacterium]|nr:rod-binding protein [SAR324 cluster bacterium]